MKTFLRRLRRAWRIATAAPALSPDAPRWGADDARALAAFLGSPEGIRLGAVLRDALAREATAAIYADPDRLAWKAGHAAGMQSLVARLDSLAVALDTVAQPAHDDRPADTLDWMNPQPTRNHA